MMPQNYFQQKGLSLENCDQKVKAFVAFLSDEHAPLVAQSVDIAVMICGSLEIPTEKRSVRKKKRMPSE